MRYAVTLFALVSVLLAADRTPPGAWCESDKLLASDAATFDHFGGWSVSVSGDVALVGSYGDDDFGSFSGSLTEAYEGLSAIRGPDHPETQETLAALINLHEAANPSD